MMAQVMNPRRSAPLIEDLGTMADAKPVGRDGGRTQGPASATVAAIPEERCGRFHRQALLLALVEIGAKFFGDGG